MPDDTAYKVIVLALLENDISPLPILDDEHVVGVVSDADLILNEATPWQVAGVSLRGAS